MDRNMELVPDNWSLVRERTPTFHYYGWCKRISEKKKKKRTVPKDWQMSAFQFTPIGLVGHYGRLWPCECWLLVKSKHHHDKAARDCHLPALEKSYYNWAVQ